MNGPTPIMLVMFSAVADTRPKRRWRCGCSGMTGNRTRGRRLRRVRGKGGRAGRWLARFADQRFSRPAAVSFELMARDTVRYALAFDQRFAIARFGLLDA